MASTLDPTTLAKAPLAILGLGVSGRAAAGLLNRLRLDWIGYDRNPATGGRVVFDETVAASHPAAILSPGLAPDHPWLQAAQTAGCRLIPEMDLAAAAWQGEITAVTGTNGKTTLVEFLTFLSARLGRKAVACGNNGHPLSLEAGPGAGSGELAVCEISSFQAEHLETMRADALLWTNFNETHLDRYGDMTAYFAAKLRLLDLLPGGPFLVGSSVAEWAARLGFRLPDSTIVIGEEPWTETALPAHSAFAHPGQRRNLRLAVAWANQRGWETRDVLAAAADFPPRRHRWQPVGTIGGTAFWNDSKATNFAAALAALEGFPNRPVWIAGGQARGSDPAELATRAAPLAAAGHFIGETGPALCEVFHQLGRPAQQHKTLAEAVEAALQSAQPGQSVLFSPGFSSFDQYRDYTERGAVFEQVVFDLKQRSNAHEIKVHPTSFTP